MQLVEKYVIDRNDPRYSVIDEAAFKSKNLYNAGNYEIRQSYILHDTCGADTHIFQGWEEAPLLLSTKHAEAF